MTKNDVKAMVNIVSNLGINSLVGAGITVAAMASPVGRIMTVVRVVGGITLANHISRTSEKSTNDLIDDIADIIDEAKELLNEAKP